MDNRRLRPDKPPFVSTANIQLSQNQYTFFCSSVVQVTPVNPHLRFLTYTHMYVGQPGEETSTKKRRRSGYLSHFYLEIDAVDAAAKPITMDVEDSPILKYIREDVIGSDLVVNSPYGPVKVIYCDYTASGRSMKYIEKFIDNYIRPYYGNTHTTTSIVSRQTTKFRDEARQIIKDCVNASDEDVVIFTGSGCTAAIHKLIGGLDIQKEEKEKTVVLFGPYEHHSNSLPWQELGVESRRILEKTNGQIDEDNLEHVLKSYSERGYKIITTFSAASNVTGIMTDTESVTKLVHKYKGFSIWDYASAGPYVKIDMNPSKEAAKDAVMLSPHKFLGGPGTPGLLIAKKKMFRNEVPTNVGGGTVLYVTRDSHLYVNDIESREEGGTPAIIESIRAGLVFKLKEEIGTNLIERRDEELCRRAFETFHKHRQLFLLGSDKSKRLPIFSFIIRVPVEGKFLHHNFVSVLLNDLFGIQARGGCACAGPYAQDLLGISENLASCFISFLNNKNECQSWRAMEVMKPGFTRINLPFFYDDLTIDYILKALVMVAEHGWKLLPLYVCDPMTGSYTLKKFEKHYGSTFFSLHDLKFKNGKFVNTNPRQAHPKLDCSLLDILHEAYHFVQDAERELKQSQEEIENTIENMIPPNMRKLRWFYTSAEAHQQLKKRSYRRMDSTSGTAKCASPFVPRQSTRRMTMDAKYREEMKAFLQMSTECNQNCCPFCPASPKSHKCDGLSCPTTNNNNNALEDSVNEKRDPSPEQKREQEQVEDLENEIDDVVFVNENNSDEHNEEISSSYERQNGTHLKRHKYDEHGFDKLADEEDNENESDKTHVHENGQEDFESQRQASLGAQQQKRYKNIKTQPFFDKQKNLPNSENKTEEKYCY